MGTGPGPLWWSLAWHWSARHPPPALALAPRRRLGHQQQVRKVQSLEASICPAAYPMTVVLLGSTLSNKCRLHRLLYAAYSCVL